jgi:hypothetical protein
MDSLTNRRQNSGMMSWTERRAVGLKNVENGRRAVEWQRGLVNRLRLGGFDTVQAEELLRHFERSQCIFEEDLAELDKIPISQRD